MKVVFFAYRKCLLLQGLGLKWHAVYVMTGVPKPSHAIDRSSIDSVFQVFCFSASSLHAYLPKKFNSSIGKESNKKKDGQQRRHIVSCTQHTHPFLHCLMPGLLHTKCEKQNTAFLHTENIHCCTDSPA